MAKRKKSAALKTGSVYNNVMRNLVKSEGSSVSNKIFTGLKIQPLFKRKHLLLRGVFEWNGDCSGIVVVGDVGFNHEFEGPEKTFVEIFVFFFPFF